MCVNYIYSQSCPDGLVYIFDNPIRAFDPQQPLSATNPFSTTITPPAGSNGLAYGPNINSGSPSPTFYTTAGGIYYYWNGAAWINTGHTTGGPVSAINITIGPNCLYNLVTGSSGQVYVYHGTSSGSLLFTIPGFIGGSPGQGAGPYDLATDNCCNIYVLKTTNPQSLQIYSSTGSSLAVCPVTGLPNVSGGNGLAIVGGQMVVINGVGVYVGNLTSSPVSFTNIATNFGTGGTDLASCPNSCNSTCLITLPVNFRSFYCEKNSNGFNSVKWETGAEEGVSFYEIERSLNGIDFFEIGKITPISKPWKYSFTDESFANSAYYYRVTAHELSGQKKSTSVCFTHINDKQLNSSAVFPNPATGMVSTYLSAKKQVFAEINIYDNCGKLTKSFFVNTEGESQKADLDISDVGSGIYMLEIRAAHEIISRQKLVVIN